VINKVFKQQDTALDIDPNKKTLESYNKFAEEYIRKTAPSVETSPPEMREWIDKALSMLQPGDTVFEIGTATPRDAGYMRSKGYRVICSDAAISFVRIMNSKGEQATQFNVLEDQLVNKYPMIFANGVFPHFTAEETRMALHNIHTSLAPGGIFAFSIKQGDGEEWIREKLDDIRFAHYWTFTDIVDTLEKERFTVEFTSFNTGAYPSHRWLNFICRKES